MGKVFHGAGGVGGQAGAVPTANAPRVRATRDGEGRLAVLESAGVQPALAVACMWLRYDVDLAGLGL